MSEKISSALMALCAALYFLDHSIISLGLRYVGLLHPMLSWLHLISWFMPTFNLLIDPIEFNRFTLCQSLVLFVCQWCVELEDYFRKGQTMTVTIGFIELKRYVNKDPVQAYEQLQV